LRLVAEPCDQVLHVAELALEMLPVALQPTEQLLAVRETAAAEAAKAAPAVATRVTVFVLTVFVLTVFVLFMSTHREVHLLSLVIF